MRIALVLLSSLAVIGCVDHGGLEPDPQPLCAARAGVYRLRLVEAGAACGFAVQDLQVDVGGGIPLRMGSAECVDLASVPGDCGSDLSIACSRPGDVLATSYTGRVTWNRDGAAGAGRMTIAYPNCVGEFESTWTRAM